MKQIVTKSGIKGYECRLRENYSDFEEFQAYSETFCLAEKLGFKTAEEAWQVNPLIQGSTNPEDFCLSASRIPSPLPETKKLVRSFNSGIDGDDYFTMPVLETETGVKPDSYGFYLFADKKPTHNQEIIYWFGGEKKGVFDGKNNVIAGIGRPPKYWKPLPEAEAEDWDLYPGNEAGAFDHLDQNPTPGNERQEGEIFSGALERILENLVKGDVIIRSESQAHYDLEAANNIAKAMYRALKRVLPIIEAERTQNGVSLSVRYLTEYEEAKAILNSITGGK